MGTELGPGQVVRDTKLRFLLFQCEFGIILGLPPPQRTALGVKPKRFLKSLLNSPMCR